jgi:Holliday junction DNA helicase RuvB
MRPRHEVTTPEVLSEDVPVDRSLRPSRLDEFIGQDRVRDTLRIAIEAARGRGEALDHLLFHGPPGLGKTTLASLMAEEMGVTMRVTSGPVLERPADLVAFLTAQNAGDILFIDEIHRLRPILEEFLYPAMEDGRIEIRLSEGAHAQTMTMQINPFTLVGATTRFGLLTSPMRARFGLVQRLNFYPPAELARIVARSARVLGVEMDPEGALELATRSRGTPRVANRLLRRVRDYAEVRANGAITGDVARAALALLDVDAFGLDEMDVRILRTLLDTFGGGPVGIGSLATALGEDTETLEEVYEPFLIQEGFLIRTPRGRMATPRTFQRFNYQVPDGQGSLFHLDAGGDAAGDRGGSTSD